MNKKFTLRILINLLILVLAGCSTTGGQVMTTTIPTSLPPTQTEAPSATPIPPSETPTTIPPTATPTAPPENVIQHFPTGQEFTVTDIHMIDATTGWAIGGLGSIVGDHVLFTTDGGSTWKDVTPPEPKPLSGNQKIAVGFFQDAHSAWVTFAIGGGDPVPSQPVVWHTTDGGTTWTSSQPLDVTGLAEIYVPTSLQFVAGQDGWLLVHVGAGMMHDYIAIYRSSDGGASWTRIIDPYIDGGIQSCTKNALLFTDATHGWLTGDCGGVMAGVLLFKTTDAGSTWQPVTLPSPPGMQTLFTDMNLACGSYDPFFFSNNLGHLGVRCSNFTVTPYTYKYFVYTTQDGGITWTSSIYPGITLYFFSADTGWSLSDKIQRTTERGATWAIISETTWSAQLDFISEQIGWAVARSDNAIALVKTENGGARWIELIPSVGP